MINFLGFLSFPVVSSKLFLITCNSQLSRFSSQLLSFLSLLRSALSRWLQLCRQFRHRYVHLGLGPRVDAQDSEERTRIGDCTPHVDEHGQLDTFRARWFSHEITQQAWPWIFEKTRSPVSLLKSTIGVLAVLISMKVFFGDSPGPKRTRIQVLPTRTDNRAMAQLSTNSCHHDSLPVRYGSGLLLKKTSVSRAP